MGSGQDQRSTRGTGFLPVDAVDNLVQMSNLDKHFKMRIVFHRLVAVLLACISASVAKRGSCTHISNSLVGLQGLVHEAEEANEGSMECWPNGKIRSVWAKPRIGSVTSWSRCRGLRTPPSSTSFRWRRSLSSSLVEAFSVAPVRSSQENMTLVALAEGQVIAGEMAGSLVGSLEHIQAQIQAALVHPDEEELAQRCRDLVDGIDQSGEHFSALATSKELRRMEQGVPKARIQSKSFRMDVKFHQSRGRVGSSQCPDSRDNLEVAEGVDIHQLNPIASGQKRIEVGDPSGATTNMTSEDHFKKEKLPRVPPVLKDKPPWRPRTRWSVFDRRRTHDFQDIIFQGPRTCNSGGCVYGGRDLVAHEGTNNMSVVFIPGPVAQFI
eukprot:snap_masked-scaffold108_size357748-processed-gene-2.12 protein:Tk09447 transcript:snap_masked-scaffold108_size357748-processed-gene-2.12-mRNA-1 annotation:"histidine kinase"